MNICCQFVQFYLCNVTTQSLRVKWSDTTSPQFAVMNRVKQDGVLSAMLFIQMVY